MKKSCFKGCFCSKAFTLVELLVVVLIISVLAAIAVPQYQKAVLKAKLSKVIPVIQDIRKAQEFYGLERGAYASSLNRLAIDVTLPSQMKIDERFLGMGMLVVFWCPLEEIEDCNMYQKRLVSFSIVFDQQALIPPALGSAPGNKSCIYYSAKKNKEICDFLCENLGGCDRISWGG